MLRKATRRLLEGERVIANAPQTVHEDFTLKYLFADLRSEPGKTILIFETSESDDPTRRSLIRSEIEAELRKLKFVDKDSDPAWPGKHTAELEVYVSNEDRADSLQRAHSRARAIVDTVRHTLDSIEESTGRTSRIRRTSSTGRDRYVNRPQLSRH